MFSFEKNLMRQCFIRGYKYGLHYIPIEFNYICNYILNFAVNIIIRVLSPKKKKKKNHNSRIIYDIQHHPNRLKVVNIVNTILV